MRVLFVTWAWPSHLYAMVPLARACRATGHEVLVASQPALREHIRQTGLPGAGVGEDVDTVAMVRGYLLPLTAAGGADTTAAGGANTTTAASTGRGPRVLQMFLAHAASMVDDLVRQARSWMPDVVVFEPTALAGPVAAAALGVPAVRHLYGVDLLYRARARLGELLAPLARRHGVSRLDPLGAATIDPVPRRIRLPVEYAQHLPMRYVPFNGPGASPAASATSQGPVRPQRPRVCVTWGTTMARLDPARFLAGQVTRALQDLDVEIVAALTADQRPMLGPVGNRTRIVEGVPLHLTLPGCDLVVAHGGAGSMLTALCAGLPQLLIPQLPDHAAHAAALAAAGAGMVLPSAEATPPRLRTEVLRLLHGEQERAVARRLQREMQQLPPPAAVVAELERISRRTGRPVPA
ncbi:MAG: nucleotide disphospho-sugar-binding domain-containing protein [Pseudonocardiaceae bacterium]